MSSPTSSPKTRPRRTSRFTEGNPLTGTDLLSQTPSPSHLSSILSEMDSYERRRRASNPPSPSSHHHCGSNSSTESFASAERGFAPKEGRRSINFGRTSGEAARERMSLDGERQNVGNAVKSFRGRLRALTASKDERRSRANLGS